MGWYQEWRPYVPVAQRRAQATAYAKKIAKAEKRSLEPIELTGRKIATTFWGQAWCDNLQRYSDFANRLPRGQRYVRNGSVVDLQIKHGKVKALVSGSDVYHVTIDIQTLEKKAWKQIKENCSHSVASLIDLLQGRFDRGIMQRLTDTKRGLFPRPNEIKMKCSCPDWAKFCKHVAATLYGVGARLDKSPELLFALRHVDHLELVGAASDTKNLAGALTGSASGSLADQNLEELFGIELDTGSKLPKPSGRRTKTATPSPAAAKKARPRVRIDQPQASPPATAEQRTRKKSARAKPKRQPQQAKQPQKEKASAKRKTVAKKRPARRGLKSS